MKDFSVKQLGVAMIATAAAVTAILTLGQYGQQAFHSLESDPEAKQQLKEFKEEEFQKLAENVSEIEKARRKEAKRQLELLREQNERYRHQEEEKMDKINSPVIPGGSVPFCQGPDGNWHPCNPNNL